MANTNKRPEEVPEQRIKLTVNYLTDEDYESIDKNRLSTELSNQLFMTPGNGGDGSGVNVQAYPIPGESTPIGKITVGGKATELSSPSLDLRGNSGDALFASPDGVIQQQIVDIDYMVCDSDEDIQKCMNSPVAFKQVYNSWIKTDGYGNTTRMYPFTEYPVLLSGGLATQFPNYATIDLASITKIVQDYGYGYWYYRDDLSTIVQFANTNAPSMFISNQKYSKYDITVRLYAPADVDDDMIGMTLGFVKNQATGEYTYLDAVRTPNYTNGDIGPWLLSSHWYISRDTMSLANNRQSNVIANQEQLSNENDISCTWKATGAGTLIRVVRDEDKICCWTTRFAENKASIRNSELGYLLSVDLGSTQFTRDKYLSCFRGPMQVGFSTHSQPGTCWELCSVGLPVSIVDTRTDSLSTYDPIDKVWKKDTSGRRPNEIIGQGRISKNTVTGDLFYVSPNGFVLLGEKLS